MITNASRTETLRKNRSHIQEYSPNFSWKIWP